MDRKEFFKELRQIDEEVQQRGVPPVALSDAQMTEVDDRVLGHIDTLYPIDEVTVQPGLFANVKKYLPPANDEKYGFPVGYAVAAVAGVVMVGALLLLGQSNNHDELGVPNSITTAELHQHVHLPVGGPKAITESTLTDRRDAYLAGYANANLYAIGETDPVKAQGFAIWYLDATRETEDLNAMTSFQLRVDEYLADETTQFWYKQGLATELVQLAAKGAMDDMDTEALRDAIRYYDQESGAISEHIKATDQRYFDKHRELQSMSTPSTPGELQKIIDITQALKVLIN